MIWDSHLFADQNSSKVPETLLESLVSNYKYTPISIDTSCTTEYLGSKTNNTAINKKIKSFRFLNILGIPPLC